MVESFGLRFDHLGLATRSPDKALAFLQALGYTSHEPVYDHLQKVNLILCESERMPAVEIIYAADEAGPLDAVLATRNELLYHLCYRAPDTAVSITAMRQAGHRVVQVAAPQPAILFGNRKVSFHLVRGFGLIEIIETGP
jgi:methylmalonyl-CoA/ethylmalonyl-CoA epimerase